MILAGHISATTAHLGIFNSTGDGSPVLVREAEYACQNYSSLITILEEFLPCPQNPPLPLYAAGFGISGPVENGEGNILFLRWKFTETELNEFLTRRCWGRNCPNGMPVELVNNTGLVNIENLETNGQLVDLNTNINIKQFDRSEHNRAWLAVAGGLGEALFYWDSLNNQFQPSSSEGGHAHFAPRNPLEVELMSYLMTRPNDPINPVNYSSVLSQKGLVNIYQFLKDTGCGRECSKEITVEVIIEEALAHPTDQTNLCTQTLDLFVSILGAEAGNLALKYFALGGVYIGGVITPKILNKLHDGTFMKAFTYRQNKDIAEMLKTIPVKVVRNPKVMLLGAAQRAAKKELMGKIYHDECTSG